MASKNKIELTIKNSNTNQYQVGKNIVIDLSNYLLKYPRLVFSNNIDLRDIVVCQTNQFFQIRFTTKNSLVVLDVHPKTQADRDQLFASNLVLK